jgi:hypothetical protein
MSEDVDNLHKNTVRISSRPKRTLIARNKDFLWTKNTEISVVVVNVRSGNCVQCKQYYE